MKINIPEEGFKSYPHSFCGKDCLLVIPEIDCKWNKNNLFLRSVIVDKDTQEVLSIGWPKFFNFEEKPDCYPSPLKYKDWIIQEKIDGSLVICDFVNGHFSMRTRGSSSYTSQQNWKDFEFLKEQYPSFSSFMQSNQNNLSVLVEITTPNNPIVLLPNKIEFTLLGAVNKDTLKLLSFEEIQNISNITKIPLPKIYSFNDTKDLKEIANLIKNWKGKEGIVLTYNNYQNRIKIKSDWYLWLHRIKSQLNSDDNLIEFFVSEGMPIYSKFYEIIETNFDWEIAQQLQGKISRLADTGKKVRKTINHMKEFIRVIKDYPTRKEQAQSILSSYGGEKNNKASMLFNLLDSRELSKEQLVKLVHQLY
jgi:hypothetical protein